MAVARRDHRRRLRFTSHAVEGRGAPQTYVEPGDAVTVSERHF
jgi:hypothetical protein